MMPSLFTIQENLSTSGTEPKPGQHSSHLSNRGFLASASLGHRNTKCNSSSTSSISHNVQCRSLLGIFGRLYLPSSNNNGKVPPRRRANTLRCPWFTTHFTYTSPPKDLVSLYNTSFSIPPILSAHFTLSPRYKQHSTMFLNSLTDRPST